MLRFRPRIGNLTVLPLFFSAFCPAGALQLRVGVKAGIPITDTFETSSLFGIGFGEGSTSATRRYTVGPTVLFGLPHGLGIEFDALHSRLGFNRLMVITGGLGLIHIRTTASSWAFPVLGTFRFRRMRLVKPFINGGPSFRSISHVRSTSLTEYTSYGGITSIPPQYSTATTDPLLANRSWYGAAVGIGADARVGRLHISPEIRYTRWRSDRNAYFLLQSNPNQVVVLLGITL